MNYFSVQLIKTFNRKILNMPELKIPYGRDDKLNVISPDEARRNTAYNCECGSPVFLKAGKKKVSHFSHYSDNPNCKHG